MVGFSDAAQYNIGSGSFHNPALYVLQVPQHDGEECECEGAHPLLISHVECDLIMIMMHEGLCCLEHEGD